MSQKRITIEDLVKGYFIARPNKDLSHGPVVDYVEEKYVALYGRERKPRDPWRVIRNLHQQGFLIKVDNGIYRYDPDAVTDRTLENFTAEQREAIFKRDGYKCVVCGHGRQHGAKLHADHIKPRNLGGKADIENGQTLCAKHNFTKKMLSQTETGKKMFINLYKLSQKEERKDLVAFCADVLRMYEKHNINSHIKWDE